MPLAAFRGGWRAIRRKGSELSDIAHQSRFASGIGAIAGGTVLRHLVILAAAPVLTRLYSPSDFGVLTVFGSLIGVGLVVSSLSYQLAIPIPSRDAHGALLVRVSMAIAIVFCGIVSLALLGFRTPAAVWLGLKGSPDILLLLGPTILGASFYQALGYWASRGRQFRVIGRTKLQQGVAQDAAQILMGLGGAGSLGLVVGYAVGQVVGVITLWRASALTSVRASIMRLLVVSRQYRAFPMFSTWAALVNMLGIQLPAIMVSHLFGADSAGQFGLAVRVLALPTVLIGQACAQVFYSAAARLDGSKGRTDLLTGGVASLLLVSGVCAFVPVIVHGDVIFRVVFGSGWQEAGSFSQALALWSVAALVSSPISTIAVLRNRQGAALWFTMYETGLRLSAIMVGYYLGSVRLAVGLYAISGVFISIVYIGWVFRLARVSWREWFQDIRGFLFASTVVCASSYWLSMLGSEWLSAVAAVCGMAACLGLAPIRKWMRQLDPGEVVSA